MNPVDWLHDAGGGLVRWVIVMNFWTTLLLGVVLLVDRLLERRLSAGWRVALYAVIVVRLALPIEWSSPLAITRPDEARAGTGIEQVLAVGATAPVTAVATNDPAGGSAASSAGSSPLALWPALAVPSYLAVSVALLGVWCVKRRRLSRALRDAGPARTVARCCRPRRTVLEAPAIGPAVVGVFRPRIVVPCHLVDEVERGDRPARELAWILQHEEAHIMRFDPIHLAIWQWLQALAWPIIAVWIAARRVRGVMEVACDDHAAGGRDLATRRAYGAALLRLAGSTPDRRRSRPRPAPAGIGWLGDGAALLTCRLRRLARPVRVLPGSAQTLLVGAMLVALTACSTTTTRDHASGTSSTSSYAAADLGEADPDHVPAQVLVTIRIMENPPGHPALEFKLGQFRAGDPAADVEVDPAKHRMTEREYEAFLEAVAEKDDAVTIGVPKIMLEAGNAGDIRIGHDDDAGRPINGYLVHVVPTIDEDGTAVWLDLDYRAFGLETRPPASEFDDGDRIGCRTEIARLAPGEVHFVLATGYIGAPMHVLAISAERIGE